MTRKDSAGQVELSAELRRGQNGGHGWSGVAMVGNFEPSKLPSFFGQNPEGWSCPEVIYLRVVTSFHVLSLRQPFW